MKQDNFIAIFFVVLLYVAVAWTVRLILLNYIQNFWLVWIIGIGAGKVTLAQGSGVTINSKDSEKAIDGQHASVTLIKTATDTWRLIGALQA